MKKNIFIISLVCGFIGLMVAIQYNSTQTPTERDTRDLWEIRSQLQIEQKTQQKLYQQIAEVDKVMEQYQQESESDLIKTLSDSIEELRLEAGLTQKTGEGVIVTISPISTGTETVQNYPNVTPELLQRLLNELYMYGATDISVEGERIINLSPIRYVNGETYVNNHAIPPVPIALKILTKNPDRLLDYIEVSQSLDDFAIESLELTAEINNQITLPKYDGVINVEDLFVNSKETGEE